MSNLLSLLALSVGLVACGTANVNKIFGSSDESTAGLLQKAQLAYDRGDVDTAEEFALKAYEGSENNGEAAVLLGNIMLTKAGVDVFKVVGKLAETSAQSSSTTTTTSSSTTCASSSKDAAGSISRLSCLLLNLTDDEIAALGTDVALTSSALKSLGSYYRPNEVNDELRAKVSILKFADRGIRFLCPFVNRAVVLAGSIDERHALAQCGDKSGTVYNDTKIHIGFALLHLMEALVYQRGVLIDGATQTGSSGKVGISTISTSINSQTFTSVSSFVESMAEFKTVVNQLADTTNSKSQIALAVDGIMVVANSFSAAGVPSKVTSAITSGLAKLKETASKLSAAAGGASANYEAQALKGQINEKYSKVVASKIDSICGSDGSKCDASQKTQLCTSYSGIAQGVDTSKVAPPSICK